MSPFVSGLVILIFGMIWMIVLTAVVMINAMWLWVALGFIAAIGLVLVWFFWPIEES